ncbi:PAS domain S-box protein [Sulfurimonas sp.]|uniref:PAS domain S-box protein n=1 Tax=Sulfurimonas sp. TaxID=2022749 RepID=UPI003565D72C
MKTKQHKREIYFIVVYFLLLAFLSISVELFNYNGVKKIQHNTLHLYNHPLKVSNAALIIKQKIYQIHGDVKDIVLSKSKEQLSVLSKNIELHENEIYKNLLVIKNNILDDTDEKFDEQIMILFKTWKPIHNKIIKLIEEGKRAEAVKVINSSCTKHILEMEQTIDHIYKFSQSKALEFKNSSISETQDLKELTTLVNTLFFITLIFILFYTIDKTLKNIKKNNHLENVLNVVREINQSIIRENDPHELLTNSYNILKSSNIYDCLWIVVLDSNYKITNVIGGGESRCFSDFQDKLNLDWKPVDIEKISKTKGLFFQKDNIFKIKIKYEDELYGFINVCFKEQDIEHDERLILEELASDIAYAIRSINLVTKLEQNEQRYHMLFQGNKTVELIIDPVKIKIVDANDKACNYYGYSYDEFINMSLTNICTLPKEDILSRMEALKSEKYDEFYCEHKLRSGDIRNVKVYSGPINVDGKTLLYSIIFDITDSLRFEKERDLIQKRLELVLEATYDGIWDWNLITDEIYFSPRTKNLIGYRDDEIENKLESWINRIHPDDKEQVFSDMKDLKDGKINFYHNIHRVKHKDKYYVWIEARGKVIFNDDKRAERVLGSIQDISIQKEAEDTILYLKNLYDNIINSIDNIIFVKDKEFKYITCNDTFLKLAGKSKEDVIGHDDFELFDNETAQIFRDNDINMFAHKKPVSNFEWVTYPNGDKVYLKTAKSPLLDSDKNIIGLVGNSSDFTREHKLYKGLKEAQSIAKIASWEYNINTKSLTYSDELYNIYGVSDIDMKFDNDMLFGFVHKDDLEKSKQMFEQSFKSSDTNILHNRIYRKNDGKLIFLEHRWIVEQENNKIVKLVGTTQDITEKKSTLVELNQKKNELETIISQAPNPMIIHNEAGQILRVNKAWVDVTGYTFNELSTIDDLVDKVYHEDLNDEKITKTSMKQYIKSLYKIKEKFDDGKEHSIKTKNGDFVIWQFSSAPLGIVNNKSTLITSATDITELKKKDDMLLNQSRNAAMGEMIGMIAHQWRQPIAAISMDANNMLLDIAIDEFDTEESEKYANSIIEQTQHLSKTIDDFRNFFKPDRDASIVNIKDIVKQTLSIVQDSIKNNNIELITLFETDKKVNAYPRELMQVFVNMITNAKDAILLNKKEDAWIAIHVYEDDKYVNIEVSDNGGGIYDEILPKIFDPYFSTKDEKTGTGLGLYMSKMIIEEHLKGIIDVSNIGEGTCFKISLLIEEDGKNDDDEK